MYEKIVKAEKLEGALEAIPEGIEITTRYSSEFKYVFVQNFNRYAVNLSLPIEKTEVILGKYDGISIDSLETVVLKEKI